MALSKKHQRFVSEYLVDLNATQAAIRAGYKPVNANVTGPRLLANVGIAAAIAEKTAQVLQQVDTLTQERVLEEYRRVATSDVRRLYDGERLKSISELSDEEAASVSMIEVNKRNLTAGDGQTDTILKVRLWDKMKALDSLANYFGLLKGQSLTINQINIKVEKSW